MKKNAKRLDGKKRLLSLTGEMDAGIRAFCREKDIRSESELIRQAVARFLDYDYRDETLRLQGLKDIREKVAELKDMIDITFRYIRLMHINILAYLPEIDGELADPAFKSALGRHAKFFEAFQDGLKNDPPFFERLLHKFFSEVPDGQG
jgi:Arc/MetJ-type ribon-helix-helix transcriptional regulator